MITEEEISHQNNNFFDLSHPIAYNCSLIANGWAWYVTQGIYEMNRRLYEQAVHSFTLAIEDKNEFGQAYVLRSRCQTLYERPVLTF